MPPEVDHTIWYGNNISTVHGNHGDVGDEVKTRTDIAYGAMTIGGLLMFLEEMKKPEK